MPSPRPRPKAAGAAGFPAGAGPAARHGTEVRASTSFSRDCLSRSAAVRNGRCRIGGEPSIVLRARLHRRAFAVERFKPGADTGQSDTGTGRGRRTVRTGATVAHLQPIGETRGFDVEIKSLRIDLAARRHAVVRPGIRAAVLFRQVRPRNNRRQNPGAKASRPPPWRYSCGCPRKPGGAGPLSLGRRTGGDFSAPAAGPA